MRRGYRRERQHGPSLDDQWGALVASGVDVSVGHPPIYTDTLDATKRSPTAWKSLAQRKAAILSLRPGDVLVVRDAATLGRDQDEIADGLAMVAKRKATLVVCCPDERAFTWHPDAADMVALAVEGARQIRSEKHARAAAKHLGAQPKLAGTNLETARRIWARGDLTAPAATVEIVKATGVRVTERTLWTVLGRKSEAEIGTR